MHRLGREWASRERLRTFAARVLCGCVSAVILVASGASGVFAEAHLMSVAQAAEGPPIVTFTGLRVREDGSSTLFVELTRTTEVEVTENGKDVSFLLSDAKIRDRNNKNPLNAEYFKANVLRAKLVEEKGGVRLVVQLREAAKTVHGMTSSVVGARLFVDVPPPSSR